MTQATTATTRSDVESVTSADRPRLARRGTIGHALITLTAIFASMLVVILLLPSPIDALPWQPPTAPPLVGPLAVNQELAAADRLVPGAVPGPEDIAFDNQGRLYTGGQDGRIYRFRPEATTAAPEVFADTGGRPLGLQFDAAGNLIVADSERGLLTIDPAGTVGLLTDSVADTPITYADELDIGRDGTIFFSDASDRFDRGFPFDMLEARPHGRLLAYDPAAAQTRILLDDLYFANGVVLSPIEDFVLVVESFRYRITRLWLSGPTAGSHDIFADNLIGIPDNIDVDRQGRYWIGMNALRSELVDVLHPRPFLKEQLAKLGQDRLRAIAADTRYGLLLALDASGQPVRSLHDPSGGLFNISTVTPHDGRLYLGSLWGDTIGRLPFD